MSLIPTLLDPATCAAILDVQPAQVWRWARSGKLKVYRLGRGRGARIRIPESSLLEFLGAEAEKPGAKALSAPSGRVSASPMSRQEARAYLQGVLQKGRLV